MVLIGENQIPAVEAIPTFIGDYVAGKPPSVLWRVGSEVTPTATVDADNFGFGRHCLSLPDALASYHVAMRVVAGELRGRLIVAPQGDSTRPTTDRAREATFNSLVSLGCVEGARTLDLFAGSGALGIEALSRGAASCTFLERDQRALEAIRHNIQTLQLAGRTSVLSGDVMTSVVAMRQMDLVLADPPYDFERWSDLLSSLQLVLADGGVLMTESARRLEPPEGWEILRAKKYGRAWVTFVQHPGL